MRFVGLYKTLQFHWTLSSHPSGQWPRDKLAGPKLFVCVVERGKCYLIFQLTITNTVDISVDNNNCPYTGQLLK